MKRIKTAQVLVKRLFEDTKEFSVGVALGRLIRDLPFLPWERRKVFYENRILSYLEKNYGSLIDTLRDRDENTEEKTLHIWVMWWQGVAGMPDIVRACYERLFSLYPNEVILVTEENYTDYVSFPEFIRAKHELGLITTTHLSDLIRAQLLEKYGGLWLDATIYVKHIPQEVLDKDFYTLYAPGLFPHFISRGKWSPFLFYCKTANNALFVVLDKLLQQYWEAHNNLIDYLLIDFFVEIVTRHKPAVKQMIEQLPENRAYYTLNLAINDAYDANKAYKMFEESPLQKLTTKKRFTICTENNRETNYSRLIKGTFANESVFNHSNEEHKAN